MNNSDSADDGGSMDLPDIPELATHPHDAFFKTVFSEPENAVAFFQSHLDDSIVSLVKWERLERVPSSFVKSDLTQSHSDLVFSAPLKDAGQREIFLHLAFEHQTTVDPAMPLRMLAYELEILQRYQRDHGLPLPPVIGLVLHQGPQEWKVSTSLYDLFDLPEATANALQPYLPQLRHALVDLSTSSPATEEKNDRLKIALQLMKMARRKELLEYFGWLAKILSNLAGDIPESLITLGLLYALHADERLDIENISRTVKNQNQLSKLTMNAAEKLIAKGRAEGEACGEARGEAKGIWIGKIQLLQEFLRIEASSGEELQKLDVPGLESLYKDLQSRYDNDFKGR